MTPRRIDQSDVQASLQEALRSYQAGLDAASPANRFLRKRTGLGGAGARHTTAQELWTIRETVRHMVRNDELPGHMISKLADQILPAAFRVEPQTGDAAMDQDLSERFTEWAEAPGLCDFLGERSLAQIAWQTLFQEIQDGDMFAVLVDNGTVQAIEADRCLSPTGSSDPSAQSGIICGVEVDGQGRVVAYHFTEKTPYGAQAQEVPKRLPRVNEYGVRLVLQCYWTSRITQYRGYSWLTPLVIQMGMLDDLDFAMLLKSQNAAAISGVVETQPGGSAAAAVLGDEQTPTGATRPETTLRPGALVQLPMGQKLDSFSPTVPNPEHLRYTQFELKRMGAAMALPYVLLMLDASETNFSGYRGAIETARATYRRVQAQMIAQFFRPIYLWWLFRTLPTLKSEAAWRLASRRTFWRHKWIPPRWRYIQPADDARSDALQLEHRLNSPRGLLAERGMDFDDVARETVLDNANIIRQACAAAAELNAEFAEAEVTWRDILRWQMAQGLSLSGRLGEETTEPARAAGRDQEEP